LLLKRLVHPRRSRNHDARAVCLIIQNLSGFGIVFYALTITFASIDWTMSLYPEWWSTVWGMLFMVGQVLTTFCFTIWLFTRLIGH